MAYGPHDFAGEVSLVLDPGERRTGVYFGGTLLDVLAPGAWEEDACSDLAGEAKGDTAAGMTVLQYSIATGERPLWLARYRIRTDWRDLLDAEDGEDQAFALRFEEEWPEALAGFIDLLDPVGDLQWLGKG